MHPYYEQDWSVLPPENNRRWVKTMTANCQHIYRELWYSKKQKKNSFQIRFHFPLLIPSRCSPNRNASYVSFYVLRCGTTIRVEW